MSPSSRAWSLWNLEFFSICSRKTLIYLILTLNQCYPDYDFSLLRARHFRKEDTTQDVEPLVDSHLLHVSKVTFDILLGCSLPVACQCLRLKHEGNA
jgi:hypothetical protein